jgi:hypothetical protein
VGPSQRCRKTRFVQDASSRPGRRVCLLKGCERSFCAPHPFSRYCSSACRAAARRWQQRVANRRYRASEQGKCHRRAQSCRYRKRVRERQHTNNCSSTDREGYPHPDEEIGFSCLRPGCYESFAKTARSPLQKFCNTACRQALRRVLIRERRWRQRLNRDRPVDWREDDFW